MSDVFHSIPAVEGVRKVGRHEGQSFDVAALTVYGK
jgi:hypothetical protein